MENTIRRREQEVWDACDDLWARHANLKVLTGDSIRERLLVLGKCKGSPNEIYKYRKTWAENRGVANNAQIPLDDAHNDPIARAVRLVHEKLQSETDDQLRLVGEAHGEQLQQKDREVAKMSSDLAGVMAEFAKLQDSHDGLRKTLDETSEQCQAEVAVRKATEAELNKTLQLGQQNLHAQSQMLNELKQAHAHEMERVEKFNHHRLDDVSLKLAKSEQDLRAQGQDYSEKLNELKLANYNLAIVQRRAEEYAEQLGAKLGLREDSLHSLTEKHNLLMGEVTTLKLKLASCWEKNGVLQREIAIKTKQNRAVRLVLRQCELKLARLRAVQGVHERHGS